MFSLLIVDDEVATIEDIEVTISNEIVGLDCIYRAHSGREAIEVLSRHAIHIVITDIRMPGMNGIELVKTIKSKWGRTKCILLSGYAEFTYAQEAVRQDVVDYLLKPVNDQKLLTTIRATLKLIKEEQKELKFYSKIESTLKENIPSLQQGLLGDLLAGKQFQEDYLSEMLGLYGLPDLINDPYVTMISSFDMEGRWERESLLEYAVRNIMEEIFNDFYLWSTKKNNHFVVLVFLKPNLKAKNRLFIQEPNAFLKIVERLSAQLKDSIEFYLNISFDFSLSSPDFFPLNVAHVYRSLESSFVSNPSEKRLKSLGISESREVQALLRLHEPPTLMHLFEAGKWDSIDDKLGQIFSSLKEETTIFRELTLEIYFVISNSLFYIIHRNGNFLADVMSENAEDFIKRLPFFTIDQFEKWTFGLLLRIKEIVTNPRKSNHANTIQKIHDYIANHIGMDVSLQTIADQVYLHPVYLSKLFKLETGEGLSEYVQRVRIEKAAYLLQHTNKRIYTISEEIGLLDPSYFIKVFKRHFGVTPQQYRSGAM